MRRRPDGCWGAGMAGHQSHPHGNPWGISQQPSKTKPLKHFKQVTLSYVHKTSHIIIKFYTIIKMILIDT